ncbi:MAG: EAL domain-containing protein [Desulfuromonadales bacterium]
MKNADTAMYEAKSRGRNNLRFYSEAMNAAARIKSDLESRLLDALSRGELQQHYQPLFNLATGRMTGVEALLRCSDNTGQPIPPEQIISVAEESGLAFPLGEWVLKTACGQLKTWQDQGLQPLRMAVNLSGHHIRQPGFIDRVETIIQTSGIQSNTLEIELSENCIMSQGNDSIMVLTDLKMRGINLAIDHFGSGFSSLLNLRHFPIHRIKISREFIRDMMHNPDYAAVIEAILLMAGSLDLDVTAVGVEQLGQLNFLRKRSCGEVQGQLFATAMTAENMTAFLRQAEGRRQRFAGPNNPQQQSFPGSKEIH